MSPVIRQSLSRGVLKSLVKGDSKLDYNKALGNVTALYRSALGGSASEVQIPLPADEKPRVKPGEFTDVEIEQAIADLFDYFEANLQTLNTYLGESTKEIVITRVWKEILTTIEGLLIPPLSETPSDMKPLTDKEVDIVFKWLKARVLFRMREGQNVTYPSSSYETFSMLVERGFHLRTYRTRNTGTSSQFDYTTTGTRASLSCIVWTYLADRVISGRDMLMEECVRVMQQTLRASPSIKKRAKSVYSQRNLGTIKDRKREKKEEKDVSGGETIMRILRMRYVLSTQLGFSFCTYTEAALPDRIRPISSRNNSRSWRRCRPSRNSASASSRSGRSRGQETQPASQRYHLCQKYRLDLWIRILYMPSLWG